MPITDKLDNVIGKVADIAGTTADYAASGHTIEEKVDYISSLLEGISAGGGSVYYVTVAPDETDLDTLVLDSTFEEIQGYISSHGLIYIQKDDGTMIDLIVGFNIDSDVYSIRTGENKVFTTDSPTGYPVYNSVPGPT